MNYARFEAWNADGAAWAPRVDVREDEQQYTVAADLPGVASQDIHVTADEGVLTIQGERKLEPAAGAGYEWRERHAGSFLRRFTLPENVDAEQIKARHSNGVLEVLIPKQAAPAPRRINVEVH